MYGQPSVTIVLTDVNQNQRAAFFFFSHSTSVSTWCSQTLCQHFSACKKHYVATSTEFVKTSSREDDFFHLLIELEFCQTVTEFAHFSRQSGSGVVVFVGILV